MFISNEEKQRINFFLNEARHDILDLKSIVANLQERINVLERQTVPLKKAKKPLTAAQKAKQRAYQKAYNERKKAKQLAEGNTNVSA